MKHPSSRALFAYWNDRRGLRAAPERADIDPTAIPHVLADTFLVGLDADGEAAFRLAGTRVCALFACELKTVGLMRLFAPSDRPRMRELLAIVCDETVPTVAGVSGYSEEREQIELELLLLPLRHRGRTDSRLLGVLAPLRRPAWLGQVPLATLALATVRHLEPALPRPPGAGLATGRMRYGLMVFDGGRE